MKRLFLILTIFGMSLLIISCNKGKKIKVAIMTKLEKASIVGTSEVNVAKVFVEDNNIEDIELLPFDDGWDEDKTIAAYNELKQQGIDFIITSHVSKCALAISERTNKDKKLTFVTGAATNELSGKDDLIIRVIQDVEQEQKSIAEYISNYSYN